MIKNFISLCMVVASVVAFIVFINPQYTEIIALRQTQSEYSTVLENSRQLQSARDRLLAKYSAFSPDDVAHLEKMVPDNPDNVKLILELQTLAAKYGLEVTTATIENDQEAAQGAQRAVTQNEIKNREYGTITLNLSIRGPYEGFVLFTEDVEKSLRLIDIDKISFKSDSQVSGGYQFTAAFKTYWLKNSL